jgi:3-methyladenine DNA glycosylase Tag
MAAKQTNATSPWFDAAGHASLIDEKAGKTEAFIAAMAGGRIDPSQIAAQESRLVALMQEVEPKLSPELHAKVTDLLCELTVYNFMQAMSLLHQAKPKTKFRG